MAIDLSSPGARRLYNHWVHGEGAAQIRWGTDGSFSRCVNHLRGKVRDPQGLCAEYHKAATGEWPAEEGIPSVARTTSFVTGVKLGWRGLLAPIGKPTGDGRRFNTGSLTHRPLPLPLTWQRQTKAGSHDGAVIIGSTNVLMIGSDLVAGSGELFSVDSDVMPRFAEDLAEVKFLLEKGVIGPSVELDDYTFELQGGHAVITKGRITNATLLPVPAFAEARAFEIFEITDKGPGQVLLASGVFPFEFRTLREWLERKHPRDYRGRFKEKISEIDLDNPLGGGPVPQPASRRGRHRTEAKNKKPGRPLVRGRHQAETPPSRKTPENAQEKARRHSRERREAIARVDRELQEGTPPEVKKARQRHAELLEAEKGFWENLQADLDEHEQKLVEQRIAGIERLNDLAGELRKARKWAASHPDPQPLSERVKGGIKSYVPFNQGQVGETVLVEFNDGSFAVRKRQLKNFGRFSVKDIQDAEELSADVAHIIGLKSPNVFRSSEEEIYLDFVPGEIAENLPRHEDEQHFASDQGKLIGLLDTLIKNKDRHEGNWLVHKDTPIPIDHGLAFGHESSEDARRPLEYWFSPFSREFHNENAEWVENPLTQNDVFELKQRLLTLLPKFRQLGREDWWLNIRTVLNVLSEGASGSKDLIK